MFDSTNIWQEIIKYALHTPSPHNTQPWKVRIINNNKAELYLDPSRYISDEDPSGIFTYTAMGIFAEYLDIAASKYDKTCISKFSYINLKKNGGYQRLAVLYLENLTTKPVYDPELLISRSTSRIIYNSKRIPQNTINQLAQLSAEHDHKIFVNEEPNIVKGVLALNQQTLFYDLKVPKIKKEIFAWLRFNEIQTKSNRDGLSAECMNLPSGLFRAFFTQSWFFNLKFIQNIIGKYYLSNYRNTPAVAWIRGPFANNSDGVAAGRLLGKIWLELSSQGIYMHPFGSVITNTRAHQEMLSLLNTTDAPNDHVWFLIRLGYSDQPPRSIRLKLEQIII